MTDVVAINPQSLNPAPWRATYLLAPDLAVLARSMCAHGMLSPIVVRHESKTIIDGHERWLLATSNSQVIEAIGPTVPAIVINCTEQEAMILHIQMNRGRGSVVAKKLSSLVRSLLLSDSIPENELCLALSMSVDELEVLLDGSIIKHRAIKNHIYSKAWVPIESPTKVEEIKIEVPPNSDG